MEREGGGGEKGKGHIMTLEPGNGSLNVSHN